MLVSCSQCSVAVCVITILSACFMLNEVWQGVLDLKALMRDDCNYHEGQGLCDGGAENICQKRVIS